MRSLLPRLASFSVFAIVAACSANSGDSGLTTPTGGSGGAATKPGGSAGTTANGGGNLTAGTGGSAISVGGAGGGTSGGQTANGGGTAAGAAGAAGGNGAAGNGQCVPLAGDCNGDPTDGCETSLADDAAHCGGCLTVCAAPTNGLAACETGVCTLVCEAGFLDCDKSYDTGCEIDTQTDPMHCGACDATPCAAGSDGTAYCESGKCALQCAMGKGDCDHDPTNGCEQDTLADANNCGSCGLKCDSGTCVNGACACAGTSGTAQLVPLDIFIMLDQSGSMSEDTAGGSSKWEAVTSAIKSFMADPANTGLGLGIQYFAIETGEDDDDDSCDVSDYAQAEVEIAPLPGVAPAITKSLGKHGPTTGTPTLPALQGAEQHGAAWKAAHPTDIVVVVLATDGEPSSFCDDDAGDIEAKVPDPAAGVYTYAIGVLSTSGSGDAQDLLNNITMKGSGNGSNAFIFDPKKSDVAQAFSAALASIRKSSVGCTYQLPTPPGGQILDPSKVNVQYLAGSGASTTFVNVGSEAGCGTTGGWHYDNDAAPTKIELCAATCTEVQADTKAAVNILLGCSTIKP